MVATSLQKFEFGNIALQLVVPNSLAVKHWFETEKQQNENFPFPFWAKVWPSAIALSTFLVTEQHYVANKKVLELASGLGLPSLVAAHFATTVTCSDYLNEPLQFVEQSISINNLFNIDCKIINWNNLSPNIVTDVLLLSDINYNPSTFDSLFNMLEQFLKNGSTIILSTPQRIMAKKFIEAILPHCVEQKEIEIDAVIISILVLK